MCSLRFWTLLLLVVVCAQLRAAEVVKVACVGDSVTWGAQLEHRETDSYPVQLQRLLGSRYQVENFGVSGATLLRHGHHPYAATDAFRAALAFHPDVVVIHLGLNDTDPRDWPDLRDQFVADYSWLIAEFRTVNPAVRVHMAVLTPIFDAHPRFQSGTRIWAAEIRRLIPAIAQANHAEVIDFYTPLLAHPNLFSDALHPNAEGASILAQTVYQNLSGDYGGLQLPAGFGDHMVLPHDQPVRLRGRGNRGESVEVQFAGMALQTHTDHDGWWSVTLPPHPPGGSYSLRVHAASRSIALEDITFGELWLCSGQSNMDYPVAQAQGAEEIMRQIPVNVRLLHYRVAALTNESIWTPEQLQETNRLQYFKGDWQRADGASVHDFSAVGYVFAVELARRLRMPVGMVQMAVGGSNLESWIDRRTLEEDPGLEPILLNWRNSDWIMPWCRERAAKNLAQAADPLQRHPYEPAYNYEAGIAQLGNLPIRGVLWYQGESNTHNPELYAQLFPRMVESWRRLWGRELPFLTVQIAGMNRPAWPEFRRVQLQLSESVPDCYLAVSSDLGEAEQVHYRNKFPLGHRLAVLALERVYAKTSVTGESPVGVRAERIGAVVRIHFRTTGGALRSSDGGALRGFVVRDPLGNWHKAPATIIGEQVELRMEGMRSMQEVAYAWEPLPDANLVNNAGLPAPTFRIRIE